MTQTSHKICLHQGYFTVSPLFEEKIRVFRYCNTCKKLTEFVIFPEVFESVNIEELMGKIPIRFREFFNLKLSGKPFRVGFNCTCLSCHGHWESVVIIIDAFPLRR